MEVGHRKKKGRKKKSRKQNKWKRSKENEKRERGNSTGQRPEKDVVAGGRGSWKLIAEGGLRIKMSPRVVKVWREHFQKNLSPGFKKS